jgi:predicted NAD/FAD-binding protein
MPAWRPPWSWPQAGSRHVFEASRTPAAAPGASRCDGFTVDNGQHILVGAYTELLRLMRAVGVHPDRVLKRTPLRFEFPGECS